MIRGLFGLVAGAFLLGAAPADWSRTTTTTPTGTILIGNPNARVKLIEYLSFTCNHCAAYFAQSEATLTRDYLRPGKVSVEFRSAVRDRLDFTAALLARCGGVARFRGNAAAIFAAQDAMFANMTRWQAKNTPPADVDLAIRAYANASGLTALMAKRGVTPAQQNVCLGDKRSRDLLLAQTKEAWQTRNIPGTPAFLVNGELQGGTWATLEPILKAKVVS